MLTGADNNISLYYINILFIIILYIYKVVPCDPKSEAVAVRSKKKDQTEPDKLPKDPTVKNGKYLHALNGQNGGRRQRQSGWRNQCRYLQTKHSTACSSQFARSRLYQSLLSREGGASGEVCGFLHGADLFAKIKFTEMAWSDSL